MRSPARRGGGNAIIGGDQAVTWAFGALDGKLVYTVENGTVTLNDSPGYVTGIRVSAGANGRLDMNGNTTFIDGDIIDEGNGLTLTNTLNTGTLTVEGDIQGVVNLNSRSNNLTDIGKGGAATLSIDGPYQTNASGQLGGTGATSVTIIGDSTFRQTGTTVGTVSITNASGLVNLTKIGNGTAAVALTVDGTNGVNGLGAINGGAAGATITVKNGSVFDQSTNKAVSGVVNVITNATGTATLGVAQNGSTVTLTGGGLDASGLVLTKMLAGSDVTATNATVKTMSGGHLLMADSDLGNVTAGDVEIDGAGNTIDNVKSGGGQVNIYGKNNAPGDEVTITGQIGETTGATNLIIGESGASQTGRVTVTDSGNIVGGTSAAQKTSIEVVNGSTFTQAATGEVIGQVSIINTAPLHDETNAVLGTLREGSMVTVNGAATVATVKAGEGAYVLGADDTDNEVHISGALEGGATGVSGAPMTTLFVGGGDPTKTITAYLDNDLNGNADGVLVSALTGGTFIQDAGQDASGKLILFNAAPQGTALADRIAAAGHLVLGTLNDAQAAGVAGSAVTIRGVDGTGNTLSGAGGFFYMDDQGDGFLAGSELAVNDVDLVIAGDHTKLNLDKLDRLEMNSTKGRSLVDVTGVYYSASMNTPVVTGVGDDNVIFKGSNAATYSSVVFSDALTLGNSVFASGKSGHVIFDASTGRAANQGIAFLGGVDIDTTGGANLGTIDFIGNAMINASTDNNLKIGTVNLVDGAFGVYNGQLNLLTNTAFNLSGGVEFDFNHGTGFGTIPTVNAGAVYDEEGQVYPRFDSKTGALIPTTASFANTDDYLVTGDLNVIGQTAFGTGAPGHGRLTVTSAVPTSGQSGLYVLAGAKALDIQAQMIMADVFTVEAGASPASAPTINFGKSFLAPNAAAGDYPADHPAGGYNTAIVMDAGSQGSAIAAGTYFSVDIDNSTTTQRFQTIGWTDAAATANPGTAAEVAAMWQNLNHNGPVYDGTAWGGAAAYYNKGNGRFTILSAADVDSALVNGPSWGRPYINALMYYNPEIADYFGNGLFGAGSTLNPFDPATADPYRELTQAMGNTLSAALMLSAAKTHLGHLHPRFERELARSAGEADLNGLWLTPYFNYLTVDDNYKKGYDGFDVKNYGATIGYDRWLTDRFQLGLFVGLGHGKLDGDYQDIDSDDVQLGVYGHAELDYGFNLNMALAYGWQSYDADRRIVLSHLPAANQRLKSSFDGNTFSADIALSKTIGLDYDMFLRPTVGYTYLGTELDAYRERSTLAVGDPNNLAQKVKETNFDLHLFRVGTDIGWAVENASVIGRLYYVGNAGDDQPKSRAYLTGAAQAPASVRTFNVYGAEYDKNMANLGLTLKVAPSDNTSFAVDYDALLGSKSTSHNVNLTFKYEF